MSQLRRSKHLKIPFEEIEKATKNFKRPPIGIGGYGVVYKGRLIVSEKHTRVAIKRLDEKYGQGLKEFLTEIELLSGQTHPNLITLVGYCDEGNEKIIVYEYAKRGSLDKYLRRSNNGTPPLSWLKRLKICVDAARGLDYLHNGFGEHQFIIHRDIKSANILIDKNWVAKISDFGLSRLSLAGLDRSRVVSHPCGTPGYCEPEYQVTTVVARESDVYSYGMVLFEVLCGRLCTVKYDDGFLLSSSLAKDYYKENRLNEIVDPSLKGEVNLITMNKFASLACRCLDDDRLKRPSMGLVVNELENLWKHQEVLFLFKSEPLFSLEGQIPQSASSKAYSKWAEPQSSNSNYLRRKSQTSSSQSNSKVELRSEKVKRIFQHFDRNKDGGLNKEELEALVVATNTDRKYYSKEEMSSELDKIFHLYETFIDGEKGLTFAGLLQIYDVDGDLDKDYEVLALKVTPPNDKEPAFRTPDRLQHIPITHDEVEVAVAMGRRKRDLVGLHGWQILETCRNLVGVLGWKILEMCKILAGYAGQMLRICWILVYLYGWPIAGVTWLILTYSFDLQWDKFREPEFCESEICKRLKTTYEILEGFAFVVAISIHIFLYLLLSLFLRILSVFSVAIVGILMVLVVVVIFLYIW